MGAGRCFRLCQPTETDKDLLRCVMTDKHAPDDDCAGKHFRRTQRGGRGRGGGGGGARNGTKGATVAASFAAAATPAPAPVAVAEDVPMDTSAFNYRIPKRTRT